MAVIACALVLLAPLGRAHAIDTLPRDFFPLPGGTNLSALYYLYSHSNQLDISNGPTFRNNTRLDAHIGVYRQIYYGEWDGRPWSLQLVVPFGTIGGAVSGTNLPSSSGLGDVNVSLGMSFLPERDPRRNLGIVLYTSMPTGNYNPNRTLNLGANRWSFDTQIGYTQAVGEKFWLDAAVDVIAYTDNSNVGPLRWTQSKRPSYEGHFWFSYVPDPASLISLGYAYRLGGTETLEGVRTGLKSDTHQARIAYSQFLAPNMQVVAQASRDIYRSGGFPQAFGLTLRGIILYCPACEPERRCVWAEAQAHPGVSLAMARAASRQAGALRSERRPITTLFCDLVDSVGLATRLDPEDLMQVLDRYKDFCDDIVTDHGGYLAQFLGDGVLAYFGYPQADEDDAANAVRAGLAILDAVAQLDGGSGSPVQVRVGIASGPVVIGDRVSRANNRTAEIVGRVPNLAARLQAAARPGSVVIADETRRVTRGLFAYQDLGALTLKGFASPVQAWEVVQSNTAASRYRARLQDAALPFVGRKHELELLHQRWAKARSGDGQVVYVIGEAGIGKSRLTEMFRQQVATEPHLLVHFYCSPQHSDSTLYPIIDSLARLAGFERQDSAAVRVTKLRRMLNLSDEADEIALAAIAGLLSLPLEGPSPLAEQTPEKRREVTIAALTDQFVRFSATQPFVVIVEDLQWVDATTLELLQNIVQQTTRSQILLILTARPEFRPPWADTDATRTLKLERLDATSSVELCRHAADNTLSEALLRQIVERSDGIPLYVEELTRTVVESLESAGSENSGSTGTGDTALIPLSLHDSLVARLDRLGAARQVANIGAVIGRKFNGDLLNAVASQLGVELRSSVRQLVRSGLVSQSGPATSRSYLFHHALIRDAAYDSLLRSDRQVLHGVIGTVLREKFPDTTDTEPEIVAHHFSRSATPLEAIVYWEKAGQRATSRAAHRDAAVHYSAALELAKTQEDSIERKQRELSLLIPLAISLSSSRGYAIDEVRDALTEARQICDLFGNVSALYPVLRGLCTFHITRNDLDIAEDLAGRCILIAKNADSIPYLIEAENALGYVLFGRGELERARHHLQAAVDLYEKNEHLGLVFPTEQDPKMTCAGLLSLTLHMQGDAVGAAAKADQSVAWARKLNRPFDLAYALVFASQYYTLSHDYAKAKVLAEESMAISQRHGFGLWYLCAHLELGCALARLGQTEEAISILEPGLARYAAIGCKFNSSFTMGELAACYAAAGRLEQARGTIDAAINRPDNQGDLAYLSFLHRIRADIMAKAPGADLDEVTRELQTAVSVARSQGAAMLESEAMARLKDILPNQVLTG